MSSQTTSRRGVISCGIFWSASRKILSSSSCSAASNTPASVPTAINILTSSSVIGGSSVGLDLNNRSSKEDDALSAWTAGAVRRDRNRIGLAIRDAIRSGEFNARRFGTSSPTTSDR
jgi:hypothetical protein